MLASTLSSRALILGRQGTEKGDTWQWLLRDTVRLVEDHGTVSTRQGELPFGTQEPVATGSPDVGLEWCCLGDPVLKRGSYRAAELIDEDRLECRTVVVADPLDGQRFGGAGLCHKRA